MPPKRKLPRPSTTQAVSDNPSDTPGATNASSPNNEHNTDPTKPPTTAEILSDPWTDEQEIALLKAIIRWKPVGMHKHFRMVAIKQFMDGQGCVNVERDSHCSTEGIWEKLGKWYNLRVLDEREDSSLISPPQSPNVDVKPKSLKSSSTFQPFSLPPEFHDMMFERRLAPEGSKSPPLSAFSVRTGRSRRGSTVPDSEEPRSSPVGGQKGRRAAGRSTRATASERAAAKAQKEAEAEAEDEEEDEEEEEEEAEGDDGAEEDNEEEEDGGEESEQDEQEGEEEDDGESRAKRSRSSAAATPTGGRGRPGGRGRGRGRTRGKRG